MPREHLYAPKELSFPFPSEYIEVVRETKNQFWTIWKRVVSMTYGALVEMEFSMRVGAGPQGFRIPNKRPHQGYSWMDGTLTKTQVTSRPETIW